jgi:PD-(D/E)XK endonuclease
MLTTDQKGAIAELAIAHRAAALGIGVFKPLTDGERYDLIFDLRPRILRVQCKWAALQGDVLIVRCRSCRRTREGLLQRAYTPEEVDAIAAYCLDLDRCYFVPHERLNGRINLQLRLTPARNNQSRGINWADDYLLDARLTALKGP